MRISAVLGGGKTKPNKANSGVLPINDKNEVLSDFFNYFCNKYKLFASIILKGTSGSG
jgi:hypothetical protein